MTNGADAYFLAMLEAAQDGEPVDWDGVADVLRDAFAREQESARDERAAHAEADNGRKGGD